MLKRRNAAKEVLIGCGLWSHNDLPKLVNLKNIETTFGWLQEHKTRNILLLVAFVLNWSKGYSGFRIEKTTNQY
ncbi:hypothetical protein GCM10009123_03920 [Kangiella japonica]|uniref:Uncharacterized protein n=1 Tax=Kangiella japonica TaxID=647384 RepID=A0ABP3CDN2_9GAMM